jgi:Glycosyltransferase 61
MDQEPAVAGPAKDAERPRAWQEGWTAAARGSLSPNPYESSAPDFPVWFAGYFAGHKTAGPAAAKLRADAHADTPHDPPDVPPPDAARSGDAAELFAAATDTPASSSPRAAGTPAGPQRLAIPSPGFATSRPTLRNVELIPAAVYRALDQVWSHVEVAPAEVTFTVLQDAWVVGEGLVFDSQLEPHKATTVGFTEEEIAAARRSIEDDRASRRIWYHGGSHVLAKTKAHDDYGHFLTECFPRAAIMNRLMQGGDVHVILHRGSGTIMQLAYSALSRLGVTLDRIEVTGAEPHQFGVLIVVDGLAGEGRAMSPLVAEEVGKLAADIAPGPYRKLYIKHGGAGTRALVNDLVLIERLAREGYAAISPREMTLREQIAAFAGAQHVVGVYGGGLANIAFCAPGSRVAVITPATMPDTSLWFLAQHKHHEYVDVRCPELPGDAELSWNRAIAIARTDIEFLAGW